MEKVIALFTMQFNNLRNRLNANELLGSISVSLIAALTS